MLTVSQNRLTHIADAYAVDKHLARGHAAVDSGRVSAHLEHLAYLVYKHIFGGNTHGLCVLRMASQMPVFTVHRHKELGLCQGENYFELLAASMARHMELGQLVVYDLRASLLQLIYQGIYALFIARYWACRNEDFILGAYVYLLMAAHGHAHKGRHGLSLTARSDYGDLILGVLFHKAYIYESTLGNVEIAKLDAHLDHILHASARNTDLSAVFIRYVDYLLKPVDIGAEGGDKYSPVAVFELCFQSFANLFFAHGHARSFGVGGVAHEKQHSLFSQFTEAGQIYYPAVYRRGVYLEVSHKDAFAHGSVDGEGHGVGYRVVDMHHLHLEYAHLKDIARLFDVHFYLLDVLVLLKLALYDSACQSRAVYRHIEVSQNIGQTADMILVTMGYYYALDLIYVFLEIGYVGNYHVDAEHIAVWECHAAVDYHYVVFILYNRQVLSYLLKSAQRYYPELFSVVLLSLGFSAS